MLILELHYLECYKGDTQNSHSRTINQKPENRGQRRNHHGGHQGM